MKKTIAGLVIWAGILLGQNSSIPFSVSQPPAASITGVSYSNYTNPGAGNTFYYWLATNYVSGTTISTFPQIIENVNVSDPSVAHPISISFNPVQGASSYSVIRTTSASFPSVPCTCLVGTTIGVATFINDSGVALGAFNPSIVAPAKGSIRLNNSLYVPASFEWEVNGVVNQFASNTYTPPFVGSTPESVATKLAQNISIQDFGAKCDGVTDDSVAIQNAFNAINTGGTVWIAQTSGACIYSIPLILTNKIRVTLNGQGATLVFTGTGDALTISGGQQNILQDVGINGTGATSGGNGVTVTNSVRLTTIRCSFFNFAKHVFYSNLSFWYRDDTSVFSTPGATYSALYLDTLANNDVFYHSRFVAPGTTAVTINSGTGISFKDCDFSSSLLGVLAISTVELLDNYFETNTTSIQLGTASSYSVANRIIGNKFAINGLSGSIAINIVRSAYNVISGNVFNGDNPTHTSTAVSIVNDALNTNNWIDPNSNYYNTVTTQLLDPGGKYIYNFTASKFTGTAGAGFPFSATGPIGAGVFYGVTQSDTTHPAGMQILPAGTASEANPNYYMVNIGNSGKFEIQTYGTATKHRFQIDPVANLVSIPIDDFKITVGNFYMGANIIVPNTTTGVHGNGAKLQYSDNTGTSGNLAKFDANGNITDGGIKPYLSSTTTAIGGSALTVGGTCASGTATITGAIPGMPVVASTSDGTAIGSNFFYRAEVSGTNTITVYVCAALAGTPASKTYNVRVIQ